MTTPAERPRPANRYPDSEDFARGPLVGEALPPVTLPDQHGRVVDIAAARNGERALVVFVRSVGWCSFCRTQVTELQRHLPAFRAAGVHLFIVTPDTREIITKFTDENAVTIPVLADTDSAIIRRFGILNTLIDPGEQYYGIPFPGIYVTDVDGVIEQRYFNREYRVRESSAELLRNLGHRVNIEGHPGGRGSGAVSAALGAHELAPYQRTPLSVRIALPEGLHVYAEPVPTGFVAMAVTVTGPDGLRVEAPRYPATRTYRVEGLDETFQVIEGEAEVIVPVLWATNERPEADIVPLDVEVRYQTCSDEVCFAPLTERIHVDVPLGRVNRAPRAE